MYISFLSPDLRQLTLLDGITLTYSIGVRAIHHSWEARTSKRRTLDLKLHQAQHRPIFLRVGRRALTRAFKMWQRGASMRAKLGRLQRRVCVGRASSYWQMWASLRANRARAREDRAAQDSIEEAREQMVQLCIARAALKAQARRKARCKRLLALWRVIASAAALHRPQGAVESAGLEDACDIDRTDQAAWQGKCLQHVSRSEKGGEAKAERQDAQAAGREVEVTVTRGDCCPSRGGIVPPLLRLAGERNKSKDDNDMHGKASTATANANADVEAQDEVHWRPEADTPAAAPASQDRMEVEASRPGLGACRKQAGGGFGNPVQSALAAVKLGKVRRRLKELVSDATPEIQARGDPDEGEGDGDRVGGLTRSSVPAAAAAADAFFLAWCSPGHRGRAGAPRCLVAQKMPCASVGCEHVGAGDETPGDGASSCFGCSASTPSSRGSGTPVACRGAECATRVAERFHWWWDDDDFCSSTCSHSSSGGRCCEGAHTSSGQSCYACEQRLPDAPCAGDSIRIAHDGNAAEIQEIDANEDEEATEQELLR